MAKYISKITISFEQDFIDDPSLRAQFNEWLQKYFSPAFGGIPFEKAVVENVTLNRSGSPENILKRGGKNDAN